MEQEKLREEDRARCVGKLRVSTMSQILSQVHDILSVPRLDLTVHARIALNYLSYDNTGEATAEDWVELPHGTILCDGEEDDEVVEVMEYTAERAEATYNVIIDAEGVHTISLQDQGMYVFITLSERSTSHMSTHHNDMS